MHGLTMLTMGMVLTIVLAFGSRALAEGGLRIGVSFPNERASAALDGRMLLMLSTDPAEEPRFQIGDSATTQQFSVSTWMASSRESTRCSMRRCWAIR